MSRHPDRVGDRRQADHPDTWLSGVRQDGAQLSATPHRLVDRPELSVGTRLLIPTDSSTLSTGTPWRRSFDPVKERTTEYPANGSSNRPRFAMCIRRPLQVYGKENNGQAARLISTSQLNASRRFHIWPINLVVYQEPSEVLRPGRSHLVEGFTLRCFQHFSRPDVATRRCRWRDNRYTRGSSNPVLSY